MRRKLCARDLQLGKFTTQANTFSTFVMQSRNLKPNALESHMRFGISWMLRSIINGSMFALLMTIVVTMNLADSSSIKQMKVISLGLEEECVHHTGKIETAFGMATLI